MNLIYCLIIWTLELVSFLINKIQVIYNSISWYHVLDDYFKTWSFIFQLLSIDSKLMISKCFFFPWILWPYMELVYTCNMVLQKNIWFKIIIIVVYCDQQLMMKLFMYLCNSHLNIVGVQKLTKMHKKKIKTHDFKINYMLHYWKIGCCLVFSQFIDPRCL